MEACSSVSMEAWSVVFDDDPELGELLDLALGDDNAEAAAAAGHKRRMMAAVASMNATGGQGPQGKKHKVDAFSWEKHVRRLTMKSFKRRYRLSWGAFNRLLDKLRPDLTIINEKRAAYLSQPFFRGGSKPSWGEPRASK